MVEPYVLHLGALGSILLLLEVKLPKFGLAPLDRFLWPCLSLKQVSAGLLRPPIQWLHVVLLYSAGLTPSTEIII